MAKNINIFPNLIDAGSTTVGIELITSVDIVNVADEAIIISNTLLDEGENYSVSSASLPVTINPISLSYDGNTPAGLTSIYDMFVVNGFMFVGYSNGDVSSFTINTDGSLTGPITTVSHGGVIYGLGGYDKVLFSARGAAGISSYLVADDGTFAIADGLSLGGGNAWCVFANADWVLMADDSGELHIYDYTLLGDIDIKDILLLGAPAYGVFADDNFIYIASNGGISSYLFDGENLIFIDAYATAGIARDICGSGDNNLIFVADQTNGIFVMEIDDNGNLILIDQNNFGGIGSPQTIVQDNGYLYVANQNATGLAVFGIKIDNTLNYIGNYNQTGASSSTVRLYNDHVYIPEGATGIERYSLPTDNKLTLNISFIPTTDGTTTDTLSIASTSVSSPDQFTIEGIGLGNSENGIGTYNYYSHALGRIAQQYRE